MPIAKKSAKKAKASVKSEARYVPKVPSIQFYHQMVMPTPDGWRAHVIVPGGTTTPLPGGGGPPHSIKFLIDGRYEVTIKIASLECAE
jgi:hypothetical protein